MEAADTRESMGHQGRIDSSSLNAEPRWGEPCLRTAFSETSCWVRAGDFSLYAQRNGKEESHPFRVAFLCSQIWWPRTGRKITAPSGSPYPGSLTSRPHSYRRL